MNTTYWSSLAAGVMATLVLAGSATAAPTPAPKSEARTAQTGCVVAHTYLKRVLVDTQRTPEARPGNPNESSFFVPRRDPFAQASARYNRLMVYRVAMNCTSQTAWKTTMQIRRRKRGPDKAVAYKVYQGKGSHGFTIGADCKKGQRFNGNFSIAFLGAEKGASRSIKDKECK